MTGTSPSATEQPIVLGSVAISRAVKVSKAGNYSRWLDSFTNTSPRAITVDVAFGGSRGPELRHQPEQDRRQLQRRHADRRRRHVGRGRQPVGHRRQLARPVLAVRQRHAVRHRQLPARPVRQRAPGHRAGGQLLRLQEHGLARPGPDEVAPALRRRGPRRGRRHRRSAGRRGQDRRLDPGHRRPTSPASTPSLGCTIANWAPLFDATTCAATPRPGSSRLSSPPSCP